MPPIVIDGAMKNHKDMVTTIKATVQSEQSLVNEEDDYVRLLSNIWTEKIPHHTYTQKQNKSHNSVLRELDDIIEDLQ